MLLDFDDRYRDIEPVGSAINRRDGVAVSVIVHGLILVAMLFLPQYIEQFLPVEPVEPPPEQQQPERQEKPMFVFVEPRKELPPTHTPERVEMSDLDRSARSEERSASVLENPLPMAKGSSSERVEAAPEERPRGERSAVEPEAPTPPVEKPSILDERTADAALTLPPKAAPLPPGWIHGEVEKFQKKIEKQLQTESFGNQKGQTKEFGPLQFDTKGVEFGPWVRRFVSAVRRNWFIPQAAELMRGHVVITFNVHKNGALTDITVVQPSSIASFNIAAVNALRGASPVDPLPPEYPDAKAFFTVTFFYNESPGQ